jgi:hypothetical protein
MGRFQSLSLTQGSVLSPTLCLIYMRTDIQNQPELQILQYTDDVAVIQLTDIAEFEYRK